MMAQLSASIEATDCLIAVDGQAVSVGGVYRLDNEQIQLLGQRHPVGSVDWYWGVERGRNGTTPASHSSGATLTPLVAVVGTSAFSEGGAGGITVTDGATTVAATTLTVTGATVSDEGAGEAGLAITGGAVQTVSLLGPYTVNWNDSDVNAGNIDLGVSIADGTVIQRCFVVVTVGWLDDQGMSIDELQVNFGPDPTNASSLPLYVQRTTVGAGPSPLEALGDPTLAQINVGIADYALMAAVLGTPVADVRLYFGVYSANDHFVAGSADIYALIATPA